MATAAQCSSWYYASPTLPLHRRHGFLQRRQPTQATARGGRWPRLQVVAAAAAGGRAEDTMKAATDAEFFQPSDTRPIMLFDGARRKPPTPFPYMHDSTHSLLGKSPICELDAMLRVTHCVQACATSATGASGSCGSTIPTGTSVLLNSQFLTPCAHATDHSISNCICIQRWQFELLMMRSALQLTDLKFQPTGASGTCRCRASREGSSCRDQGDPPTTSPALFSSRKTGG